MTTFLNEEWLSDSVRFLSEDDVERKLEKVRKEVEWKFNYMVYLQTPEWQELRKKVIERAKGICENCGLVNVRDVHHLTYQRFKKELLSDLLGVCRKCHDKLHLARSRSTEGAFRLQEYSYQQRGF